MSCYLLPIEKPEAIYTMKVKRYDPESGKGSYWATYQVPYVATMTVIEALEYMWDHDEYISFRANCREFTCGSCAMIINGEPRLACNTLLEDNMTLEPLTRYSLIKDLVVDTSSVKEKIREIKYWPETDDRDRDFTVTKEVSEDWHEIYSRCIECYCCLEACPMSSSEESKFDGPMHMLQLARTGRHPLNTSDRVRQASERGIWACVGCFECANVCPVNLSPGTEVAKLRRQNILKFFGLGKGSK